MQLSSEAVNVQSIAQKLQGHKQLQRLKKLVFYTSTGNWENDANVLNDLSLEKLLEDLCQSNSSLEELSDALYQSVDTLNHQTVYSELANLIIAKIGVLYQDSSGSTEVIMIKPSVRDDISEDVISQVIEKLTKNPEVARIKKLIFYLVKEKWENDKTEEGETLLFGKDNLVTQIKTKETEEKITRHQRDPEISPQQTTIKPEEKEEIKTNKTVTYTVFDWRLDIMQYTNPLRVKILLFSLLYHQFKNNEEDWSKLKSCTLEELLTKILTRFESFAHIETKLDAICKESKDVELYQQTAAVVSKSIMSFYDKI